VSAHLLSHDADRRRRGLDDLAALFDRAFLQLAHVSLGRNHQMTGVVGEGVENDDCQLPSMHDVSRLVVRRIAAVAKDTFLGLSGR
jgi:hypothetical protein